VAYPGGLDLLVFIGKWHYGLLEDFFQVRSMWYLENISRGGKKKNREGTYMPLGSSPENQQEAPAFLILLLYLYLLWCEV